MRIAYLGQMADLSSENGISKKISAQAGQWRQAGHTVRYFALAPSTMVWAGTAPLEVDLVRRGNLLQRSYRSLRLVARIREWTPDLIYFRYAYHSAGLPKLFRTIPTVAEINSDDVTEYPITLPATKVFYHRLTRRRVLAAVTAFIPVTHEIASRLGFPQPMEVIANAIDLDSFTHTPTDALAPLRLVFVGSAGTPWHGLERVAELADLLPQAEVDVIGCTEADWRYTSSAGARRPSNLHFHGPLSRKDYEPLLASATAAIGTMALFRKKMNEACPLKVREYLALGLPVLAAYQDTDIPASADYYLRLPNNSAPLLPHRSAIASWLESWRGRRVARAAIAHVDIVRKEERRLAFMSRFARASGP